MKEIMLLVAIGAGIELLAAPAATRLISHSLFGLEPNDPLTMAAATSVPLAVAGMAGSFPAHRASKVDPLVALRDELAERKCSSPADLFCAKVGIVPTYVQTKRSNLPMYAFPCNVLEAGAP